MARSSLQASVAEAWYGRPGWLWILLPVEWVFIALVRVRRWCYSAGWLSVWRSPIPVIIVGNIVAGGSGKTPLVLALTKFLSEQGYRPGLVSRGYRAKVENFPALVTPDSDAEEMGDEPLLLAQRSGCPVVIDPDRTAACKRLLELTDCDVILADDGLQHYGLARDVEIVVVDRERGFGNGHCLPVGPLREPISRLSSANFVLYNGDAVDTSSFALRPTAWINVADRSRREVPENFAGSEALALAGIGNPGRFFSSCRKLGIQVEALALSDHADIDAEFLSSARTYPNQTILMTEKDAVKCTNFADANMWYLEVVAELNFELTTALQQMLPVPKLRRG
ncbi:MAG: tetraacyldisaccharide 4'-kinase [Halieaceae bacterium]|jgi:tetraacyldisaccharide 4'-kinase